MSGQPTEAEIQAQWKASVDILENMRDLADNTMAGPGNKLDSLLTQLEGEYTPYDSSAAVQATYQTLSAAISPATALAYLRPIVFEYGNWLSANGYYGGAYTSAAVLFNALFEYMSENSVTVQTRAITFASPVYAGGNTGNGALHRLTVDKYGNPMEACHVEEKQFRCRRDQNNGTEVNAEVFESLGQASSGTALQVGAAGFGSGESSRTLIASRHAGTGSGGSLLLNSSWSTYSATATPKFQGWTESSGSANISQDTSNYYRTHPGASVNGSLKLSGSAKIVQSISTTRARRMDPNEPYFLRIMVNQTIGSASGGNIVLRLGSVSKTVSLASLGSGWQEVILATDENCFLRNFNEQDLDIEIEWQSASSGYLLVDDAIFCVWDIIDGTYYTLVGNNSSHSPWLIDDTITVTDTGGAPGAGKLQWWAWRSGLGYLPSSATPSITDP